MYHFLDEIKAYLLCLIVQAMGTQHIYTTRSGRALPFLWKLEPTSIAYLQDYDSGNINLVQPASLPL